MALPPSSDAQLVEILSAQVAALESALRDSSRAAQPAAPADGSESDRAMVLAYTAELLLTPGKTGPVPPAVAAARDRLAQDDPARAHFSDVRRHFTAASA